MSCIFLPKLPLARSLIFIAIWFARLLLSRFVAISMLCWTGLFNNWTCRRRELCTMPAIGSIGVCSRKHRHTRSSTGACVGLSVGKIRSTLWATPGQPAKPANEIGIAKFSTEHPESFMQEEISWALICKSIFWRIFHKIIEQSTLAYTTKWSPENCRCFFFFWWGSVAARLNESFAPGPRNVSTRRWRPQNRLIQSWHCVCGACRHGDLWRITKSETAHNINILHFILLTIPADWPARWMRTDESLWCCSSLDSFAVWKTVRRGTTQRIENRWIRWPGPECMGEFEKNKRQTLSSF